MYYRICQKFIDVQEKYVNKYILCSGCCRKLCCRLQEDIFRQGGRCYIGIYETHNYCRSHEQPSYYRVMGPRTAQEPWVRLPQHDRQRTVCLIPTRHKHALLLTSPLHGPSQAIHLYGSHRQHNH